MGDIKEARCWNWFWELADTKDCRACTELKHRLSISSVEVHNASIVVDFESTVDSGWRRHKNATTHFQGCCVTEVE